MRANCCVNYVKVVASYEGLSCACCTAGTST